MSQTIHHYGTIPKQPTNKEVRGAMAQKVGVLGVKADKLSLIYGTLMVKGEYQCFQVIF